MPVARGDQDGRPLGPPTPRRLPLAHLRAYGQTAPGGKGQPAVIDPAQARALAAQLLAFADRASR